MKKIIHAMVALLILYCQSLNAQNNLSDTTAIVPLNEVEIIAEQNKSVLDQPVSIAKLTPVELKRGTGLYLDDAVNANIPGVFMERRTVAAGQQFNIRGYGNGIRGTNGVNSNFDGQGYKVYLNGIPITDAEGITLMDDIDFNSVDNVQVTKGPSGTLYGLAIAGVVNLKTIRPERGKTSLGQNVLLGSDGLTRLTTHFQMGGDRSAVLVNYGHQSYDGFMVHTASHKDFVSVLGEFQPNEKESITTYAGFSNSYDERNGELTIGQYDTLNYSGNPAYIKNNAHSNVISFRAGLGHAYAFNRHLSNTTSVFGTGISSNVSSAGGWTDKDPINYGARTTFDMRFSLSDKLSLNGVAGGELQHQYAQIIGYPMIANPNPAEPYNIIGTVRSNQVTRTQAYSLFTEWSLLMPGDLSLTAGIGMSVMTIGLDDRFYVASNTKPTTYEQKYDGMFSPHFALNKVFNRKVSVYASYSTGQRAPVSSYFFIPTTNEVNTGLKPEIGTQIEIGSKGDLFNSAFHYEIALFSAQFTDKMTTVAVPLNPPDVGTAYSYIVNRGSQDDKGLEVLLKYNAFKSSDGFLRSVSPFANFCFSDFTYKDYTFQTLSADKLSVVTVDYSGNDVAGVPPITANAGIDIMTKIGIYGNVGYSYRGIIPYTSDNVNKTEAFSLVNAKLGFQHSFGQHFDVDLFAGANNITGTQYYFMVFLNQLPDAYLAAPFDVNYFGGVNLRYNF
ncbi:MAG TPA: TonB-dependent receptor [Saprospiraceae bacterium]|nr:TonB-dependent receptor [Saprospiraceae bacterium]